MYPLLLKSSTNDRPAPVALQSLPGANRTVPGGGVFRRRKGAAIVHAVMAQLTVRNGMTYVSSYNFYNYKVME